MKDNMVLDENLKRSFIRSMERIKQIIPTISDFMDIGVNEMLILANLSGSSDDPDKPDVTYVSDILRNVLITKSAVSQTLNVLEKKELITRKTDLGDRRKVSVFLTQKGTVVAQKAQNDLESFLQIVFERFGEENVQTLVESVTGFANVLHEIKEEMRETEKGTR